MGSSASRLPAPRRVELLRELRESLLAAEGLSAQLDVLGELLAAHFADYCVVDLVQSGELTRTGIHHADWSRRDRLRVAATGTPHRLIPGALAALLLRDEAITPRPSVQKELGLTALREPIRSVAVVGVRMFGDLAAVVTLVACRGAPFGKNDLAFLGEVAAWTALVMERTALDAPKAKLHSFAPWSLPPGAVVTLSGAPPMVTLSGIPSAPKKKHGPS